jgi:hypothetical protein
VNSYDGSSQTWKDLSGGGYDFYRGSGSGSDSADPTFNGTAGKLSSGEYFSYDGGDYFTLAQSNPAWVNDLHKDNAVFTILSWEKAGFSLGDIGADGAGIALGLDASLHIDLDVFTTTTTVLSVASSVVANPASAWAFSGISFTESAGTVLFASNGSYETKSGQTYSSPATDSAGYPLQIGAQGNGLNPAAAGRGLAAMAIWSSALSQAQIGQIFQATRVKFGV